MAAKKPIIILSGPVGAGKSTVAKDLISYSQGAVAYIEGDTFWSFITKGATDRNRHQNFKMIMISMVAAAMPYALNGYEVILDFSIPPWFIENIKKVVRLKEIPLDYIVLCPSEAVCIARAAQRAAGTIDDYTPYHDLYLSFDEAKANMISDDTSGSPETAKRIRKGIDAGQFRIC